MEEFSENDSLSPVKADQLSTALRHLATCIDAYLPREDGRSPVQISGDGTEPPWCFGLHLAYNAAVRVERLLNPARVEFPGATPDIGDTDGYIPIWQIRQLLTRLYVIFSWQDIPLLQLTRTFHGFGRDSRIHCPSVPNGFSDALRLFAKIIGSDDPATEDEDDKFSGDTSKKYPRLGKMPSDQQSIEWLLHLQNGYNTKSKDSDWMRQLFDKFMQNHNFKNEDDRDKEYDRLRKVANRYQHAWNPQ